MPWARLSELLLEESLPKNHSRQTEQKHKPTRQRLLLPADETMSVAATCCESPLKTRERAHHAFVPGICNPDIGAGHARRDTNRIILAQLAAFANDSKLARRSNVDVSFFHCFQAETPHEPRTTDASERAPSSV
jgi:hypothetical protein